MELAEEGVGDRSFLGTTGGTTWLSAFRVPWQFAGMDLRFGGSVFFVVLLGRVSAIVESKLLCSGGGGVIGCAGVGADALGSAPSSAEEGCNIGKFRMGE